MKIVDVKNRQAPDQLTVLATGASRAGKSHFAATWPRPIVLADASEHGYTTFKYMSEKYLYEPDRRPYVVVIETPADIMQCFLALEQQAAGQKVDLAGWPVPVGKWEVGTVVIDSLTYYADAYMNQLEKEHGGGKVDGRRLYGMLSSHLRALMIQYHSLPYHVVWTALAAVNDDSNLRGALIAGQTSAKAPARCDLWMYLEPHEKPIKGGRETKIRYDGHTQNYQGFKAGHRFGDLLPAVIDPEFAVIEECLEMEPWTNRIKGAKGRAKPAKTEKRAAAR